MEVVVDGDALPECFVDGFTQGIPETLAQGRQAPISATAIRIYKNLFPIFFCCLYRCLGSTVFPGVYHIEYIRQPCDDSIPFRKSESTWWVNILDARNHNSGKLETDIPDVGNRLNSA